MNNTNTMRHAMSQSLATKPESMWFPGFTPSDDGRPVLFCFAFAGGSSELFWQWQDYLASTVQICPVELPGRGRRYTEPFIESIKSCADAVAHAIQSLNLGPSYLFGHSLGSIVALETAKRLKQANNGPLEIIVSGRHAPHVKPETRNLASASDGAVVAELRRLGGTAEELLNDQDILNFILPIVRQDFALIERHHAKLLPLLDIPVHVCCGETDPDVPEKILERWGEVTTAHCSIQMFRGGHFYINESRDALLEHLAMIINDHKPRPQIAVGI